MPRKVSNALATVGEVSLILANSAAMAFGIPAAEFGVTSKMPPVEHAQFAPFFFGGANFCWYPLGWNGPGG